MDLVLLTVEVVRQGTALLGDAMGTPVPFNPCADRVDWEEHNGEKLWRCPLSRRYGTPRLLRLLCPQVTVLCRPGKPPACLCRETGDFQLSWLNVLRTTVVLAIVWGGLAWLGLRAWNQDIAPRLAPDGGPVVADQPGTAAGARAQTKAGQFIASARRFEAAGRFAEARIEYLNAIQQDEAAVEARLGLAACALRLGRKGEAQRAYAAASRLDPARAAACQGLDELRGPSPGTSPSSGTDSGDRVPAAVTAAPGTAAAPVTQRPDSAALQAVSTPETEAAKRTMEQAEQLVAKGYTKRAIALYEQLAKGGEPGLAYQVRLAELLLSERRFNDAAAVGNALIQTHPENAAGHAVLAELLLRKGLGELARKECDQALALAPTDPKVRELSARTHLAVGDASDAVRELEALIKEAPDNLDLSLSLASGYERLGRPEKAVECLETAATRQPASPVPCLALGQLHLAHKDVDSAIAAFRRALERAPDNIVALNNLAMLLVDFKDADDEAMSLAARARQLYPDDTNVADTLGWVCLQHGDSRKAVEILAKAVAQAPLNPTIRYHLAAAYLADRQLPAAQREVDTALALAPGSADAVRTRKLLADIQSAVSEAKDKSVPDTRP